ncbi:MAG: alpha/beta hydrolase [Gemmataceae bacterium]
MFKMFKKMKYAARVLLSRKGGEPEIIEVAGQPTMIIHGGEGPPFVYLHSTLGESLRWLPFYDLWARDFTVYVPSHPGFHRSGGFDLVQSIEDMAFHYIELFDALGWDEVILGGVSLGGWIAAEFAVRWPERVKKLWLSGAPGLWTTEAKMPDLFRHLTHPAKLRELNFYDPNSAVAEMIISDEPDDERRMMAYQSMTVLARLVWERPYDPKLAARLSRVKCPVLLLWGENDRLVPPAFGQEYARHLPQARWQTIPKSGHLVMFDQEAAFVEAVRAFALEK